jgi:hypothetical protein
MSRGRPLRRPLWWGAGLALVALLAGGGVLAATGSASSPPAGPAGQAAVLNTMLNSASSIAPGGVLGNTVTAAATPATPCLSRASKLKAAGHPLAARLRLRRCHDGLRLLRVLGGIHGQFTFKTPDGTRTLAYERGVIQSLSGAGMVVRATDGTTLTWVLGSSTVIREEGQRVAESELSGGETVFAAGPVVSGSYDARLIVIQAAGSPSAPPAGSGS